VLIWNCLWLILSRARNCMCNFSLISSLSSKSLKNVHFVMQKTALSLLSLKLCALVPKHMENNIGRTSVAVIMDFMQDIIFHTRSDMQHALSCPVYMRSILIVGPAVKYYQLELVYESYHLQFQLCWCAGLCVPLKPRVYTKK
jgi:hypothetical protein